MEVRCVCQARSALGEGALWMPDEGVLYWVDQMNPALFRFDPASGANIRIEIDLPDQIGALVPRRAGGLVMAGLDGISFLDLDTRTRQPFRHPAADKPRACFNDAKCDRTGRLWAGTTDRQEIEPLGELYSVESDGRATRWADGFICSNGPSFSPDGRILYHTVSYERSLYAYDLEPETGTLSNRRLFVRLDADLGGPDGSTVDADGYVWTAQWGGGRVIRLAPDGSIDREVRLPARSPTSCAFGGPDLSTLYVTSASGQFVDGVWMPLSDEDFEASPLEGSLFAIDVGVRGLPEPAFAG